MRAIWLALVSSLSVAVNAATYTGSGWHVAIIDTGLNRNFTSINSKIRYEASYSMSDVLGTNEPEIKVYNRASTCRNGVTRDTGSQSSRIPRKTLHLNGFGGAINYYYFGENHGSHVADVVNITARSARMDMINASHYPGGTGECTNHIPTGDIDFTDKHCMRLDILDIERALDRVISSSSRVAAVNLSVGSRVASLCAS